MNDEKKKILLHLTVDSKAKKALQNEAERKHTTVSAIINQLGWSYAEKDEKSQCINNR